MIGESARDSTAHSAWGSAAWGYWVVTIFAVVLAVAVGFPGGAEVADSECYRLLAEGHVELVVQPFSNRQLEPLLVRVLADFLHMTTGRSFEVLALVSTIVCVGGVGYILYRSQASLRLYAAAALLPVWASFDHGYLLPDIFYSALLTVFLLCLWRKSYWLAAALLLPLYVSREAAILVLVCLLIAGVRFLRTRVMVGATVAATAGALISHALARGSQSNVHHLPAVLYLIGKVPFNFMQNVVGIAPWVNTLRPVGPPFWIYHIPSWLHLGAIKVIGICPFHLEYPVRTLLGWMGGFGILPLVLCVSMRGGQLRTVWNDFFFRFCILYGVISFIAGPLLGSSVSRLILHGWPAFLVALPLIWPLGLQHKVGLIIANFLSGWTAFAVSEVQVKNHVLLPLYGAFAVVLACWIFAILDIRCKDDLMAGGRVN